MIFFLFLLSFLTLPLTAWASEAAAPVAHLTDHPLAPVALAVFVLSYAAVLFEEMTHMRKCKPVILGAGLIWVLIAFMGQSRGFEKDAVHGAVTAVLAEYAGLMLFLLAAMTFINALQERRVFETLRAKLVNGGFNKRSLFWITGALAFLISPLADNMTTALIMGAVVVSVGGKDSRFIALSCINIVSAANAGGAFSPFGDVTTLMVWQAGHLSFFEFFALFLPSVVNYLIPAAIMSLFIAPDSPDPIHETARMKPGAKTTIFLGIMTLATAVIFEQVLGLPAFLGMMTGMAVLMLQSWHRQKFRSDFEYNVMGEIARAEWDTLLFFFGIIMSVGGLGYIGYLDFMSTFLYGNLGNEWTSVVIGLFSAVLDNIPLMFAVLQMNPSMDDFQWLLITLTTGVGGTLLSIGSAAGVALMGIGRGHYNFSSHLKWAPVLLLGYFAAIGTHFLVNG